MNNDLKYYRVVFDERVYVKDLALLKVLLLPHDQVFNLIFSSAQRQCFSLVRLKTIIFFSESWILWILTKRGLSKYVISAKKKINIVVSVKFKHQINAVHSRLQLWKGSEWGFIRFIARNWPNWNSVAASLAFIFLF